MPRPLKLPPSLERYGCPISAFTQAVQQHLANDRDDRRLEMRIKSVDTSYLTGLKRREVTNPKDDGAHGRGTGAVKAHASLLKQFSKLQSGHTLQQGVLVRVMRVKRRAIYRR